MCVHICIAIIVFPHVVPHSTLLRQKIIAHTQKHAHTQFAIPEKTKETTSSPPYLTHPATSHTNTANKQLFKRKQEFMNISILLAFLASYNETDLFDSVRVDGGLRLQDAHRLCLLGALRHLPHLLSDEVMDTIQCLHSPLDQTHTLCCAYINTHKHTHGWVSV